MIRSMTGFGDASAQIDGVHYHVEVRSLNNKYFKATIRLPEHLQALEAPIDAVLRRTLNRGTITLTAAVADTSASAAMEVNHEALSRYIEQVLAAPAMSANAASRERVSIDAASLLSLPGVLRPPSDESDRLGKAIGVLEDLAGKACAKLVAMREREGEALLVDLLGERDAIVERLGEIREKAPAVVLAYETRLRERIDALLTEAGVALQPVDVIREIASYAERTDIAEEISRLGGHMEQFEQLLSAKDLKPIGRTLDFLAQEMLREANTIASKSPDSDISKRTVEIKGSIDRIKEQVQNVE